MDGGRTPKYRAALKDESGEVVNRRVHPEGYPVRIPDANGSMVEKERREAATETLNARSEFLELPKDNKRYIEIVDWIANGEAVLRFEEKHKREAPDKDGGPVWDVWVVYLDIRGYIPSFEEMAAEGYDVRQHRFGSGGMGL